jgi:hypothetical protein
MNMSALTTVETTPAVETPARPENLRPERRRTNRFCTELLVRLRWLDKKGCVFDGPGVIRSISADDLGLSPTEQRSINS